MHNENPSYFCDLFIERNEDGTLPTNKLLIRVSRHYNHNDGLTFRAEVDEVQGHEIKIKSVFFFVSNDYATLLNTLYHNTPDAYTYEAQNRVNV